MQEVQEQETQGDSLSVKSSAKTSKVQLKRIEPRTKNQSKIFDAFDRGENLFITGRAGTGKSFLSIYLALEAINAKEFNELVIVRSAVPARRQGFLPGNEEEKNAIFEQPYEAIVNDLFNTRGHYKFLKNEGKIRFLSTSYLRGITIDNAVIYVDEVQDFNGGEIDTIITRTGQDCQLIISGDAAQNDLLYLHEESCIENLTKIMKKMPSFTTIEMELEDIQRNDLVKEWLIARDSISNTIPRHF